MKEQAIYWQDHRGVMRSMSIAEYEKFRIGRPGEQPAAAGKDPGQSVSQKGRESETKIDHPDTILPGSEKKDPQQTKSFVTSGRNFGTPR